MEYHDTILTITICRGDLAVSIGEQGLMVKNWSRLTEALEKELHRETENRGDGHLGSSAVGELLLKRLLDRAPVLKEVGLDNKPDKAGHPNECWPEGQPWF